MEFRSEEIFNEFKLLKMLELYTAIWYHNLMILIIILIKGATNLEYTVVTVTWHVPPTVKTTHVTYKMETVIHVNPDGLEYRVKQVRRISISSKKKKPPHI